MELVDKGPGWYCYKPEKVYLQGHLVFAYDDLIAMYHCISTARKYGRAMVDIGFATNYYMTTHRQFIHVAPVLHGKKYTFSKFFEFLNEQNQSK